MVHFHHLTQIILHIIIYYIVKSVGQSSSPTSTDPPISSTSPDDLNQRKYPDCASEPLPTVQKIVGGLNVTILNTTDCFVFEFDDNVGPLLNVSKDESIKECESVTTGYAQHNANCNPNLHRIFWNFFWMNPQTEETIQRISIGFNNISKSHVCNELDYQHCDLVTKTCECDEGSVFVDSAGHDKCRIVETGFGCGPFILPDLAIAKDGRECAFKGKNKACVENAVCMKKYYNDSRAPDTVCNVPQVSNKSSLLPKMTHANQLVEEYYNKAKNLTWLKRGDACSIIDNFGPQYTSHADQKLFIVNRFQYFHNHNRSERMCNPFEHNECHPKKHICACGQEFVEVDGTCHLSVLSHRSNATLDELLRKLCEWHPEIIYIAKKNHSSRPPATLTTLTKMVDCAGNSTCELVSNANISPQLRLKGCVCKSERAHCPRTGKDSLTSGTTSRNIINQSNYFIVIQLIILLFTVTIQYVA